VEGDVREQRQLLATARQSLAVRRAQSRRSERAQPQHGKRQRGV